MRRAESANRAGRSNAARSVRLIAWRECGLSPGIRPFLRLGRRFRCVCCLPPKSGVAAFRRHMRGRWRRLIFPEIPPQVLPATAGRGGLAAWRPDRRTARAGSRLFTAVAALRMRAGRDAGLRAGRDCPPHCGRGGRRDGACPPVGIAAAVRLRGKARRGLRVGRENAPRRRGVRFPGLVRPGRGSGFSRRPRAI